MNTIQFVNKSSNSKVGPIPVTNSSRKTCPNACPLNHGNGCYADAGFHTRINWDKVTRGERGDEFSVFLAKIKSMHDGQLWRHNVSGDLDGDQETIDNESLAAITAANKGKRGFTYTHYPIGNKANLDAIHAANNGGFTVNLSANSVDHAISLAKTGLPIVTILPINAPKKQTVDGIDIIVCPAVYKTDVTCSKCKLCSVKDRKVIVGFPAHGTQSKKADLIATSTQ